MSHPKNLIAAMPPVPQVEGVDEAVWLDVIQKMDEVYSQLVNDEIALEEKNTQLEQAYRELSDTHEALKRTQQQLLHSEKMASLGRLVAGVAHELNNPISFVLGNVFALKRYSERLATYLAALDGAGTNINADAMQPELRAQLRIDHILQDLPSLIAGTLEGAQRTTDIVTSLRRFSAVDRDEFDKVDLNDVIGRAIHWIGKGAASDFIVHWAPRAPLYVNGNDGKLLQVLMNLIRNACDAATPAAPPAASAASTEPAIAPQLWIAAQVSPQQDTVTLLLHDNGAGIAPVHLTQLFDPFFTTKPVGKGTGLGLSISYSIIEQHGGRLHARNHMEGGAEFVIELPAFVAPPPPVSSATPPTSTPT